MIYRLLFIELLFDCSATELGVAEFMSQLDNSHVQSLNDLNYDLEDLVEEEEQEEEEEEEEAEVPVAEDDDEDYEVEVEEAEVEVEEVPVTTQASVKKTRSANYNVHEDEALCHAWMNVSLDATTGTDQCKDNFWGRIEE